MAAAEGGKEKEGAAETAEWRAISVLMIVEIGTRLRERREVHSIYLLQINQAGHTWPACARAPAARSTPVVVRVRSGGNGGGKKVEDSCL